MIIFDNGCWNGVAQLGFGLCGCLGGGSGSGVARKHVEFSKRTGAARCTLACESGRLHHEASSTINT